ncbi:MAG: radical SAM protein, partial [Chloroflexi bacterium]|nr:radical SAM protein [Chloroflexota bacterium]
PEPAHRLAKLYIEPTSRCNLACRTCMRNGWGEPLGDMAPATFARIMGSLHDSDLPLTIFFGGIGEPLVHPEILNMVRAAKAAGAQVELISNGTLLDDEKARGLIAAGLDRLWVSLDGATPEGYTDVRLGAALSQVIRQVARLRDLRESGKPEIGIAFVAMRRNISELPALLRLSRTLGASRFMVTNVLPYTATMCDEVLYSRALSNNDYSAVPDLPDLSLPKMDRDLPHRDLIRQALADAWDMIPGKNGEKAVNDRCPFIDNGVLAVGWDGGVSPCLPLLHNATSYLHGYARQSRRWVIGRVQDQTLRDLWDSPLHSAFRERVRSFDFSPCTMCDGCILSESNEADCYGNEFPTCGGCLWAQGIIQCP